MRARSGDMARVITDEQNYYDIADAIRGKLDVETLYLPSEMAAAIETIETGIDLTSEDEGKVVVEDEGSYVLAEQTSLSVSQNGTYDTTTNDEVVVEVSGGSVLVSKTITQNGTYDPADDQADGYSSVTVNVSGGSVSDNDLLFHFDGDFKNSGKCDAAFSNATSMEISNEQSKFGGHSLKFLGSQTMSNVALYHTFSFGTDDFTIDFWAYPTSLPSSGSVPFSFNYRSVALYLESDRLHCAVASSSGSWTIEPTATVTIPTNEWSHFALVRDGSDVYMFLNGVKVSTTDFGNNTIAPVSLLTLGSNTYTNGNRRFAGYLDELRIKLGEAVWTEDFTPPTQPYV